MGNLKYIIALSLLTIPLAAKSYENRLHELSLYLEDAQYQLNHLKTEIDLFHQRISQMETSLQNKIGKIESPKAIDSPKFDLIEKEQELVKQDLARIKKEIVDYQNRQIKLEDRLNKKIKEINKNISYVISLLDNADKPQFYTVQSGDSLGQIAQDFKVPIHEIKKYNHLTSDHIFVGQKLKIP